MFNLRSAIVIAVFAASVSGAFAHGAGDEGWHQHSAKLYDARGRLVGTVVDAPMQASSYDFVSEGGVIMNVKGAAVFVGVTRLKTPDGAQSANSFMWSGARPAYSGAGCTGTRYVWIVLGLLRPAVIERKGGKAVLYVAKDQPSQYESIGSQGRPAGCEPFFGESFLVWPIGDSLNLSDEFPEPLTVGH
ncbi:hypothetical protein [Caballeronia grimmiae]|uniref:hypothetical protein n=1 Tax=Caballeronia grimmiae TaxID=1071679 RepID=UPI0038BA8FCB